MLEGAKMKANLRQRRPIELERPRDDDILRENRYAKDALVAAWSLEPLTTTKASPET